MELVKDAFREVEGKFVRENKIRELWKEVLKDNQIEQEVE